MGLLCLNVCVQELLTPLLLKLSAAQFVITNLPYVIAIVKKVKGAYLRVFGRVNLV